MWLDNASDIDILFYRPYATIIADIAKNKNYNPLQHSLYTEEQISKLAANPKILFHAMKKAQEVVKSMQMNQGRELKNMADKIQNEWNQPFKDFTNFVNSKS